MNLLHAAWLPVRRTSTGERDWIAPAQLSDPDVLAFDAPRPDFNGALLQFAIGLLQTTASVERTAGWARYFHEPPDAQTLKRWFSPVADAFELDGAGARFMQDLTLDGGARNGVSALLIDAPGAQTLRYNADLFVKRGQIEAICPHCLAAALFTLQTNAPSGGAGHLTGLRGGGPLTTLVVNRPVRSLWHDLWLNVQEQNRFLATSTCDADRQEPSHTFPWLVEQTRLQREGGELAPVQVHPAHVFWAMPRRIRVDFDDVSEGVCDLCGRKSQQLVRHYITKTYGLDYKGAWNHPLSPYYENKGEWLCLHPQPGGIGYRHWLAWVLGANDDGGRQKPAAVVDAALDTTRARAVGRPSLQLRACGFDMDKMKARCWYDSTLPTYGLTECERDVREAVATDVTYWIAGARAVALYLRGAVKDAWFGGDARGDFSMVDSSFWAATDSAFYLLLRERIEAARLDKAFDVAAARQQFHATLVRAAFDLFDAHFVGAGAVERQHPQRLAQARTRLRKSLYGPKLRKVLALPDRRQSGGSEAMRQLETV